MKTSLFYVGNPNRKCSVFKVSMKQDLYLLVLNIGQFQTAHTFASENRILSISTQFYPVLPTYQRCSFSFLGTVFSRFVPSFVLHSLSSLTAAPLSLLAPFYQ